MQELVMERVRGDLTNGVVLSSPQDMVQNLAIRAPVSKSDHYVLRINIKNEGPKKPPNQQQTPTPHLLVCTMSRK